MLIYFRIIFKTIISCYLKAFKIICSAKIQLKNMKKFVFFLYTTHNPYSYIFNTISPPKRLINRHKPEGGIVCIGWRLLSDENIREGSTSMEWCAKWLCLVLGTRFSTPVNSRSDNKYRSTSKAPKTHATQSLSQSNNYKLSYLVQEHVNFCNGSDKCHWPSVGDSGLDGGFCSVCSGPSTQSCHARSGMDDTVLSKAYTIVSG